MRSCNSRRIRHLGILLPLCVGASSILFSLSPVWAEPTQENLTLAAGNTATISNVDPGSNPTVRFSSGTQPFYIEAPTPGKLVVMGASRGQGDVSFMRDGSEVTYHVTVSAVADPLNPTVPGKNPPALGAPHFDGPREPIAPVVSAGDSAPEGSGVVPTSVTPAGSSYWTPSASSPAAHPAPDGGASVTSLAAAVTAASNAPVVASAPPPIAPIPASAPAVAPIIPAQSIAPQVSGPKTYLTDPSYVPSNSGRGLTIPGRNPLPVGPLTLMEGTASVYDFPEAISRISISNSKTADVQVVNPHQLMLVGKEEGFTSLFVWDDQNNYVERQVRIEKGGEQQVLLNVIVAEVNRGKMQEQGIDVTAALSQYGLTFASMAGYVAAPYTAADKFGNYTGFFPPGGNYYPLPLGNPFTYAIGGQNQALNTNSFFQFIEDHSLGKILAEPNLLATSGQESKFLSGGEIPIVYSQALNTTIVFKQYGTSVAFVPTVVGRDEIELEVKPEVSAPDYAHQVVLNGYSVPSFVTRKAETLVRLHDNQTLVIAGLIQDETRSELRKVPYLGDLPYAGALFRSTTWNHSKTELVMSVTPRLVSPIPYGSTLTLPTASAGVLTPENVRTHELKDDDITRPRF